MKGNGKPRSGGKKAPAKTTGNGHAAPKTAEVRSDESRMAQFHNHYRKIVPAVQRVEDATTDLKALKEIAKKEGFPWKYFELAMKSEHDDGVARIDADLQRYHDIKRWMNAKFGEQLDMFPKQSVADRDFEDGRVAALKNLPARTPTHLSQQGSNRWLEGHAEGRAQKAKAMKDAMAGEFAPLGKAAAAAVDSLAGDDDQRKAA